MDTILLSKLIGIFCLAMGASMLNRNKMTSVFKEMANQHALSCVMGVLMLILGLILTLNHTSWESYPAILITLIGWWICFESVAFLFLSKETLAKYMTMMENTTVYYLVTLGYFLIGAYLSYSGFVTQ